MWAASARVEYVAQRILESKTMTSGNTMHAPRARSAILGKLIAGLIGGVLTAAFGIPLAGILSMQFGFSLERLVPILFPATVVAAIIVAMAVSRPARAWRYLLICAGSLGTALAFVYITLVDAASFTSAGLLSFISGIMLLLVGLLIGREANSAHPFSDNPQSRRDDSAGNT